METIQQSEKLETILSEIPQDVIEMYHIMIDTFMSERVKIYIKSPVWMTLTEVQIKRVVVHPSSVEIKCESMCILMSRERKDLQICVY